MSIFSNILHKIFPANHPAVTNPIVPATTAATTTLAAAAPTAAAQAAMPPVEVEPILSDMAAQNGQSLNWKTSIVDLLKLLGLDSDLASRKDLAKELNYTGDTNDSATMNVWLIKQVMAQLAANGGKVPASLMD